ncbi:velvet factor-domain-containing protein [Earliella scabrosa]|nr:velvet factor-domain-containing protein [Earliella scabrosa]
MELQKADAGRKCVLLHTNLNAKAIFPLPSRLTSSSLFRFARKDKRPLDPPPVVQVQFFEVLGWGTSKQKEEEILEIEATMALGLLCQADLYPVGAETDVDSDASPAESRAMTDLSALTLSSPRAGPSSQLAVSAVYTSPPLRPKPPALTQHRDEGTTHATNTSTRANDVIAYYESIPITESSNSTDILAGARTISPVTIEHNQRPTLLFVFNDLAVQEEGTYALAYRIFDIFSKTKDKGSGTERIPIIASCFGGVFRVWSTKSFPGLSPSTELTKRLALYGALVNVRSDESDRKGKGRKKRKTAHQPEEQEKEDATASPLSQISETPSVGAPESTSARGGFPAVDWGQHSPK